MPDEATTTALRRRINELYSESQSNRDHRNPTKRRYYEGLCEVLPTCRIILLDSDKRARYDHYRERSQNGQSVPEFDSILDEIAGAVGDVEEEGDERIGLLSAEGDDDLLPADAAAPAAKEFKKPSARKRPQPASNIAPTTEESQNAQRRRISQAAQASLAGSVFSLIMFTIVALATWLFTHHDLGKAILFGAVAGIATWIITHFNNKTPRAARTAFDVSQTEKPREYSRGFLVFQTLRHIVLQVLMPVVFERIFRICLIYPIEIKKIRRPLQKLRDSFALTSIEQRVLCHFIFPQIALFRKQTKHYKTIFIIMQRVSHIRRKCNNETLSHPCKQDSDDRSIRSPESLSNHR